jgi:hypothetical protein
MSSIFNKPFDATASLVKPAMSESNVSGQGATTLKQGGPRLLDQLAGSHTGELNRPRPTSNSDSLQTESPFFAPRQTRTTRAKLPDYTELEQRVPKYSIEVGLGPPWER